MGWGTLQPRDTAAWTLLVICLSEAALDWSSPSSQTLEGWAASPDFVNSSADIGEQCKTAAGMAHALTTSRRPLVDFIRGATSPAYTAKRHVSKQGFKR